MPAVSCDDVLEALNRQQTTVASGIEVTGYCLSLSVNAYLSLVSLTETRRRLYVSSTDTETVLHYADISCSTHFHKTTLPALCFRTVEFLPLLVSSFKEM